MCWWPIGPHPGPRALIYFGGNAEDVSLTRAELAVLLPDTPLYLLHYRGYGGSEGSPSEAALRADARALHAHVAERHSAVTVVGRSLGTGPAVHLAATRPVQRLVLLVPFDSLLAVARGAMPRLPVDLWEDAHRYREGNGVQILAMLRSLAINAMRLAGVWSITKGIAALAHDIKGMLQLVGWR